MALEGRTFHLRAETALQDPDLKRRVRKGTQSLADYRANSIDDLTGWEKLRDYVHQVRVDAMAKLPDLLEQLETNCERNGIQVHWADSGEQARKTILEILQQRDVSSCVKGKSMVSEEIGLREHLEANGIESSETDLGEFIVQISGEKPSHIIAPAIHKSKEQVARLFHEKFNVPYVEDAELLTAHARRFLREKFRRAGAGITGVNIAIAETGTLCIAENEGNIRMATTLPPVHIALMGIEKVIERLQDLPPVADALTRSCTGQRMSTYFSMISAPRKATAREGPEEVHLVLLDNGRSTIYADPELRQTLLCLRCGACLNHCPVYTRIGGHAYGQVYTGPIGSVLSPQLFGMAQAGDLVDASTLCGACAEICPAKIPIPDLLIRLRWERNKVHKKAIEPVIWHAWRRVNQNALLCRLAGRFFGVILKTGLAKFLPGLCQWTRNRAVPKISSKTLREQLKQSGVLDE